MPKNTTTPITSAEDDSSPLICYPLLIDGQKVKVKPGTGVDGDFSEVDQLEFEKTKNNHSELIAYSEDGKNYLIGPDGTPELITYTQLSDDYKDVLQESIEVSNKINNLKFILAAIVLNDPEKKYLEEELSGALKQLDL